MLFDVFVLNAAYRLVRCEQETSVPKDQPAMWGFSFHQKNSGWLYLGGLWSFADFTLAQETTINYSAALEVRFSEGRSIRREKQCNLSVGDLQSPHCLKPHYNGQWRTCIRYEEQTPQGLIWSYSFHLQSLLPFLCMLDTDWLSKCDVTKLYIVQ